SVVLALAGGVEEIRRPHVRQHLAGEVVEDQHRGLAEASVGGQLGAGRAPAAPRGASPPSSQRTARSRARCSAGSRVVRTSTARPRPSVSSLPARSTTRCGAPKARAGAAGARARGGGA